MKTSLLVSLLSLLARQAPMPPAQLRTILRQLEAEGFATDRIVFDVY